MTLLEAVSVLNRHDHNDCNDWQVKSVPIAPPHIYEWIEGVADDAADPSQTLMSRTKFEALIIAEAFLKIEQLRAA